MAKAKPSPQAALPSVDRMFRARGVAGLIKRHGRPAVAAAVRDVLAQLRAEISAKPGMAPKIGESAIAARVADTVAARFRPSLVEVFNLTGTVLHTNLGRAPLPAEAVAAMVAVASGASNLEFDLAKGKRGDRDAHIDDLLTRLTGAEAATAVNNNAAAVLLVLNTLAERKEVPVSRGELIEIGGAFRMPDIMKRAGCKLVEVGTTNRTHLRDFEAVIGPKTAALMKVHTSNYEVTGFTKQVFEKELAALAHEHGVPMISDLGSGSLVDLSRWGLPHEPTVGETLAAGADVVTFSGDKLLGGPQAGLIVGRKDLIAAIKKNPIKRATRLDKVTIAALGAVLRLYQDPAKLAQSLPSLRLLARTARDIRAMARRLEKPVARALDGAAAVEIEKCQSQIGSGSLPVERLQSAALVLKPAKGSVNRLAEAFRALPVPVIGRVQSGALHFDLRCLDNEAGFLAQLDRLALG